MTYQVRTLRRAKRDLAVSAAWYLERSSDPDVSEKWLSGAEKAVGSLASNPQRCVIARESNATAVTIRELLYGSGRRKTHRILFRILEDEYFVEVIAVRHVAQRDLTPDDL